MSNEEMEALCREARFIILNGGRPGDSAVDQWLADTEQFAPPDAPILPPYQP